jgi:hypothetical protein
MLFNSFTTTLFSLFAVTSAWPTAFSLVTRDALADPVAVAATDVTPISGAQVAILNVYNTTSTSPAVIAGAKKCQTKGALAKLEDGACWSTPSEVLGVKLTSIVAGCKGMSPLISYSGST